MLSLLKCLLQSKSEKNQAIQLFPTTARVGQGKRECVCLLIIKDVLCHGGRCTFPGIDNSARAGGWGGTLALTKLLAHSDSRSAND